MTGTPWRRATAVAVLAVLLPACAVEGLAFQQDDRVEILAPENNETVTLPLEVRWSAEDFDGKFAVFFDRSPMRPGRTLLSIVPEDDPCRSEETCPDDEWLADHDVYVTDDTKLVVELLPDRRDNDRTKDRHDLTIVFLDETGRRRLGEAAFYKEFIVERD